MSTSKPTRRPSLKKRITQLKKRQEKLTAKQKKTAREIKDIEACLTFLGGILKTHQAKGIPSHTSNESMFFFRNKAGECCLVKEFNPSRLLMPEMKRIPLARALTKVMSAHGGKGYVIQRVIFSGDKGSHELMLICFDRFLVETL